MEKTGQVFEQSTDAVFGIDVTGRIRFVNDMFERLLGYSRPNLCGNKCSEVLCGTDLCGLDFCGTHCPVPKTLEAKPEISDFDLIVKHASGHDVLVNIGANYIQPQLRAKTGQIVVFFSIRQVNPQRMLQRMTMTTVEGPAKTGDCSCDRLTFREKEILDLAVTGKTTTEIGCSLSISTQTVRTHFKNIYQKLDVNSRTEAVIMALQQN